MKKLNKRSDVAFNSVETYATICICYCGCASSTTTQTVSQIGSVLTYAS